MYWYIRNYTLLICQEDSGKRQIIIISVTQRRTKRLPRNINNNLHLSEYSIRVLIKDKNVKR